MQLLQQLTKADALNFAPTIIESIDNGSVTIDKVIADVAFIKFAIKNLEANDKFKKWELELEKTHGKRFQSYGVQNQIKEAGVKYDYSQCNHPELAGLELQAAELQVKIKAIQKQLQTLPLEGVEQLFGDEVVRIYPPAKTSTTILQTTLL